MSLQRAIVAIAFCAIVAGVVARVSFLDRKVYGFDESVTSLRVAGRTLPSFEADVRRGAFASLADVRARYQVEQPDAGIATTIAALIADDPQHPPVYFVAERAWQRFGTSVAARRSLAVIFGLLLLPALWWFAATAFDRVTAAAAVALVAVSPFFAIFSQYNREYGLWALLTAVASALYLQAERRTTIARWAAYGATALVGLYTFPFFLLVLAGHAAYAARALLPGRRATLASGRAFSATIACVLVAYGPWLAVMVRGRHVVAASTQWNAAALPFGLLASKWIFEIANVFFDAEYGAARLLPLVAVALVLAAAAMLRAAAPKPRDGAAFALCVILACALPFVASDLAFHASRSTAARYLVPVWLGMELLVAAGIVAWTRAAASRTRVAGAAAFAALVLLGAFSLAQSLPRTSWWIDSNDASLAPIAATLVRRSPATLCYVDDAATLLELSDAVTLPVRLAKTVTGGCFAVATPAEIAALHASGGRFVAIALPAAGEQAEIARIHARTSIAHGVAIERPRLWTFVSTSRSSKTRSSSKG